LSTEQALNVVDLTNCDREPIQIPGSVQPHGILVVMQEPELRIVQVSTNVKELLGRNSEELLGLPISELVTAETLRLWNEAVLPKRLEGNPLYLMPMQIDVRWFEGSIHRHDGLLLLQLEPYAPLEMQQRGDIYLSARQMFSDLQEARTLGEFADTTAQSIRQRTGHDRVVVYQFLEDDSGEVVGESKREDMDSWLGLRYPASDIPKQARALYLKSWLRIIADVGATPAPLMPAMNPISGAPLDMSYCVLRSVSPVHIQYMKNMGSQASMSLSLIHEGKLWGLIACQHDTPKQISHEARVACEFLAHSVSHQIGVKQENEYRDYYTKLQGDIGRLKQFISTDANLDEGLLKHKPDVRSLFRASGAAVITSEGQQTRGVAPNEAQIRALLVWLKGQVLDAGIFTTDRLSEVYPEAAEYQEKASGLLAMQVEEEKLKWLLWFRQEMVQVVNWAGNPSKPVEVNGTPGMAQLSPRRSFALWREEKRGISEPWWKEELLVAAELRREITETALKKVQALARANQNLSRSNVELEDFAYVASHDLKEPLRGIQQMSQILQRSLGNKMSADEHQKLELVLQLTSRMDELIESLLQFSRVGQLELETGEVDGDQLVTSLIAMMKPQLDKQGITVRLPRPLGAMRGDRVRLRELLQNLIANAAKYNDKSDKWIEVGHTDDIPKAFYVRDNGIGIDRRHHDSIFVIFKRLYGPDMYGGGSGAGLTISKKIVERHGGKIWLESTPGEGTTFYFTLGTA